MKVKPFELLGRPFLKPAPPERETKTRVKLLIAVLLVINSLTASAFIDVSLNPGALKIQIHLNH